MVTNICDSYTKDNGGASSKALQYLNFTENPDGEKWSDLPGREQFSAFMDAVSLTDCDSMGIPQSLVWLASNGNTVPFRMTPGTNAGSTIPETGSGKLRPGDFTEDAYGYLLGIAEKSQEGITWLANQPRWGWTGGHIEKVHLIVLECDRKTIDEQWQLVDLLLSVGLQVTAVVYSGGKSLHIYLRLKEPTTDVNKWSWLSKKFVPLGADPAVSGKLRQPVRPPGFPRNEKGRYQTLEYLNPEGINESLDSIEEKLKVAFKVAGIDWGGSYDEYIAENQVTAQSIDLSNIDDGAKKDLLESVVSTLAGIDYTTPNTYRHERKNGDKGKGEIGWFPLAAALARIVGADTVISLFEANFPPTARRTWRRDINNAIKNGYPYGRTTIKLSMEFLTESEWDFPDSFKNAVKDTNKDDWQAKHKDQWIKYQSLSLDETETEAHGQRITKTIINQPYFADVDMFREGKGTGIKGGMGLGKTTAKIEQCQSLPGLIDIGYRNSLGRQTTYKINYYPGDADMVMMSDFVQQDILDGSMLYLCADSLPKLVEMLANIKPLQRKSLAEYVSDKYIFIDEVMSVIDHIFYSKTLSEKRIEVIDAFAIVLRHCKGFSYADANLADWAIHLLAYWSRKDQEIVVNTYNNISANLTFLDGAIDGEKLKKHDNYAFLLDMREAIDNNQPIAVCSDSQIFLESLQEYLATFCKDFKSERVDGKTSSEPRIQRLVENPDQWASENPVFALLYNTSAESGIDISIKDHFVGQWGFYFGIIPVNSFCQLMGRLRDQNCPRYVWARTFSIASNDDQISFSAEALMHYERQALMLSANLLMDDVELSSKLQLIHQNSFPVESAAAFQAKAMRNYEKTNLRECIFYALERSGYNITRETITRTDRMVAAKTGFKDAKDRVKTQNVTDIATASTKYVGMPTVRLSMDANYADQCAITKAQWIDRLPGVFDPDDMDQTLLRIVLYDAPRLIQGMEKLALASSPEWLTAIGKSRLNKSLERNAAIPWMKSTQYLECKLLAAIDIQTLVNTLLSQTQLSANDEIVTAIHEKIKGTISIDGQKARGSHYLRRSIPKDPVKLASLLLSKVGIPHNVKDGRLRLNSKLMAKIRPYKDAIELSIKTRFVAMVERILSKPVPEKTVTVRAVTPQTPQAHTEQASQPFSENIFCYKDPMQKKPPFVLSNSKQEITPGTIIFDEVCQTERVVIAIDGQTVISRPVEGGGETALTRIDWVRLAG